MKKICKNCREEFELKYKTEKYCSNECFNFARKKHKKEYRKTDKYKEWKKEYQKNEKYKEYSKEYYKDYHKEYRKSDKYREYQKKYYQSEAGKIAIRIANHKRRALKKQVLHEDYKDWLKELRSHKFFICHWCGKKFSIDKLNLDHVVPLSKGGVDTKENLVPCCKSCNSAKRDKDPEQFNETLEQPRLII